MNIRLVGEVLKQWRSNPEERALGEVILYMVQMNRQDVERATLVELVDTLSSRIQSIVEMTSRIALEAKLEKERIELEQAGQTYDTPNIKGRTENEETSEINAAVDENYDGQEDGGQNKQEEEGSNNTQTSNQEEIVELPKLDPIREKIRRGRKPNASLAR